MKEEFIEFLEVSKQVCEHQILEDIQMKYRDYVVKHKNELTLIESKKIINQEYFAVLVSLICDNIDSIDKFEDIFKNHSKDFMVIHYTDYGTEESNQILDGHCCCGHSVHSKNTYTLRNLTTGYKLLIGCD